MNTQVASAVSYDIDAKTSAISELVENTRSGTKQAATTSEDLGQLAINLQKLVGEYRI